MDVARGPLETGGAFVKGAVDTDVSEFSALEAGFVVTEMVARQGSVMVTASPPNVSVFQGNFLFFGQRGRQGGGGGVLRSGGSFLDEVLDGGKLLKVSV